MVKKFAYRRVHRRLRAYSLYDLADNKLASYSLLEQLGVSQPETLVVKSPEDAQRLLDKYGTIVIKPVDGAHGRGVTTGITQPDQVGPAIQKGS